MEWKHLFCFLLGAFCFFGAGGVDRGRLKELLKKHRKYLIPALLGLLLCVYLIFPFGTGNERIRVMNGMAFTIPDSYVKEYADGRYGVWKYEGTDKKTANLILSADIRGRNAQFFQTVEEVLAECDWLGSPEIYVNPQGVRMVRGFAAYAGSTERRYYIESDTTVMLMSMHEDERFYSRKDCEDVLLQVAESVCPAR